MTTDPFSDESIALAVEEITQREQAIHMKVSTRMNTIAREHFKEAKHSADLEKLRQQAARLARKAGVKKVRASDFEGRTANQLINVIREAQNVLEMKHS